MNTMEVLLNKETQSDLEMHNGWLTGSLLAHQLTLSHAEGACLLQGKELWRSNLFPSVDSYLPLQAQQ